MPAMAWLRSKPIKVLTGLLLTLAAAAGVYWYGVHRFGSEGGRPPPILEEVLTHYSWAPLHIYRLKQADKGLFFLISDRDGWNPTMKIVARRFARLNYVVVGIDWRSLSAETQPSDACVDTAKTLLDLGQRLVQRFRLVQKLRPLIGGDGVGASVVYAALAQAPKNSFHAGLSLNFCPQWPLRRAPCPGRTLQFIRNAQGLQMKPSSGLRASWYIFQVAPACDRQSAEAFIDGVDSAKLVDLSRDKPSPPLKEWLRPVAALVQWLDPRLVDQSLASASKSGLPLIEVPAVHGKDNPWLAVMLTGDGGWANLDKGVATQLAGQGIATIALNSLDYFWKARTPQEAAQDLQRILRDYLRAWHKKRVLLIGYSFGADALPFMANRLPDDLRSKVDLVAMLGLSASASFEFHLSEWLGSDADATAYPVAPEVAKLNWCKRLCIMGAQEAGSACPSIKAMGVRVVAVPGSHHFDEDYKGIVRQILAARGGS
jgi:type IV secretory pathway VirJ component